jgi:hypothetical protein
VSNKRDIASQLPSSGSVGVQPPVVDEESVKVGRSLAQTLYTVRYKTSRAVIEAFIAASSLQKAQQVAKAFVNTEPGRLLLVVKPAIVADETILLEQRTVVPENELSRQ